jgi:uncharacterized membrane protein
MSDLGALSGVHSEATANNAAGQIVGNSTNNSDEVHAVLWIRQ